MKHGDKVYYHRHHHVKRPATWLCWITRGDRRLAMMKVKGSHRHIEVAPRRRLYWRRSMIKWNFQLWLALNGAQHINTLFCKPINQSKPRLAAVMAHQRESENTARARQGGNSHEV